jgi:protein-S-isoprenylcysteine O-methyltransferase Ste14
MKRIIYPPMWLLIGIVLIFALDEYWPLSRYDSTAAQGAGGVLLLVGLWLLVSAGGLFRKADTEMIPFREVRSLVTRGVYRYTRNPMYLAMTLILLGVAITVAAVSALAVPPAFMLVVQWRYILPEEALLREQFGEDYRDYCQRVRRWL